MDINEKTSLLHKCISCCCCWLYCNAKDGHDSPMDDPNSSLVGHVGRSYTLNAEPKRKLSQIPTVTVTEPIEDECIILTTKRLLTNEQEASSISLSKYPVHTSSQNISFNNSTNNSSCSTLRTGEKKSFIYEVLMCRDSFLKSLEWCDNSLTRGKKCRFVKQDDWIELKSEGTQSQIWFEALMVHDTQRHGVIKTLHYVHGLHT